MPLSFPWLSCDRPKHEVNSWRDLSIICNYSVWTNIFNNTDALRNWPTMTLGRLILFTSTKVVLDRRPLNTFSKSNTPSVLLSMMQPRPFFNGCLVRARFLFCAFFHLLSILYSRLSLTASNPKPPIWRWPTSVELWMQNLPSLVFKNLFDQSGLAVYIIPRNGLKYANVNFINTRSAALETTSYSFTSRFPYFLETVFWEICAYICTASQFLSQYGQIQTGRQVWESGQVALR